MKIIIRPFSVAIALSLVCSSAFAQVAPTTTTPIATPSATTATPVAPVVAAPAAPVAYILRQGTQVRFTVVSPVNSKEHKVGKRVELQLADDVVINNKTVLPKGTAAFGELTLAKKSGSFGKSGKMAGRLLYMKNGDQNIPVTGTFDDRGKSGTAATVGVAVLAGVFSAFVKGKNAVLEAGTEITGTVERDTTF